MGQRQGATYIVTGEERETFERTGYVHLPSVLTEDELVAIDVVYDSFMRGEIEVPGRDIYDMVTGEFGTDPTNYTVFNVASIQINHTLHLSTPFWKSSKARGIFPP